MSSTALIVGGVAVAAGVGLGVGLSQNNNPNPTATPTSVPPTATPTPVPNNFIEAEATWSGPGNVDVQIIGPSGSPVGQVLPAGCESSLSRTERVVLQGTAITNGSYQVRLSATGCGTGTPTGIATVLTVNSDTGPKCASAFINVPVGGAPVTGCQFTVP